ncbi:hypothetical protein [Verminephrobacter eiseniae]|uniref:hypothetical protein n=1 Tax=Verminephrobacter eiseniae TaxID=364317 RepID=UPI0000DC9285|nr:hypothetical protein [Verminephrobacter eiseniae]
MKEFANFVAQCLTTKFSIMKTKKKQRRKKLPKGFENLPKGFRYNPALDNNNYDEQPLFKEKVDRANHILKTVGLPDYFYGKKP